MTASPYVREAALTAHQLIAKFSEAITTSLPSPHPPLTLNHLSLICYDVTRRVVVLSVTDSSLALRSALLSAFIEDVRLDRFLLQADLLTTLSLALHDEYSLIRESAILLLGRLSSRNPAIILPTLRRTLMQLLHELQAEELGNIEVEGGVRGGGEGRRGLSQEEGAKLLGSLIGGCHALIKPYVDSILGVLVPKLGDKGVEGARVVKRSEALVASVLSTLGKLSVICGEDMTPFLDHLMPLLLDSLYPSHILRLPASTTPGTVASPTSPTSGSSSSEHRQMTLRTLTLLLSSTSSVISPFVKYPHFLPCLLHLIKTEKSSAVRMEAMRVIGVVGAIDPFEYRRCQAEWSRVMGEGESTAVGSVGSAEGKIRRGASAGGKSASAAVGSLKGDKMGSSKKGDGMGVKEEAKVEVDGDDGTAMVSPSVGEAPRPPKAAPGDKAVEEDIDGEGELYLCQSQSYEEYYPSVAIAALMRVVVDGRLRSFHSVSLNALIFILKTLGREKCQPFLPSIVPVFLREVRVCEEALKESYIAQLAAVVQLVGAGVKEWVEEMMEVALTFWPLPRGCHRRLCTQRPRIHCQHPGSGRFITGASPSPPSHPPPVRGGLYLPSLSLPGASSPSPLPLPLPLRGCPQ